MLVRIVLLCGFSIALAAIAHSPAIAQTAPKPATDATKAANQALQQYLNFNDREDFANAARGFVGKPDKLIIKNDAGGVAGTSSRTRHSSTSTSRLPTPSIRACGATPSSTCNTACSRCTTASTRCAATISPTSPSSRATRGWIVFDPLISAETAKAAYDLVTQHLGQRPVVAVVYSHSHIDHYGGVRGIVDEADVKAGKVQILAPEHFTEHASQRERDRRQRDGPPRGLHVRRVAAAQCAGRRQRWSRPDDVDRNGDADRADARNQDRPAKKSRSTACSMVFQMTPGTEAPAEMNTYFPQFRAMWMAENSTNTLHNVLTLRGAQVRDPLKWASYLNETIELYGDKTDVKFQSHHWPMWGNAKIIDYWKKQRDLYKYIHDQSVRPDEQGLYRHRDLQHDQAAARARQGSGSTAATTAR